MLRTFWPSAPLRHLVLFLALAGCLSAVAACGGGESEVVTVTVAEPAPAEAAPSPPSEPVPAETEAPNACARPYSEISPWNTPVPDDAVVDEDATKAFRKKLGSKVLTSDPTQYTYPVYLVSGDTPRLPVKLTGWFSNVGSNGAVLRNQRGGTVDLPIPEGAKPAAGDDRQIILLDPETGDEWGASSFKRKKDGTLQAWNAYHYNTAWSGVPPLDDDGRPFFNRGAGIPYLLGLVRPCEIEQEEVEHALAFAYTAPSPLFVFPATKSDGVGKPRKDLPEGARLQLDPTISEDEIKSWSCTGPCLTIARALQTYGMYVIDNSGRPKVMLEYEGTANWDGKLNQSTVSPIPLDRFRVVRTVPPDEPLDVAETDVAETEVGDTSAGDTGESEPAADTEGDGSQDGSGSTTSDGG